MTMQRVLTGITPSGTPHLGNYAGAIRPAIEASRKKNVASFFFLADYHALIKSHDPQRLQRSTLEIAATWLAAGLDTDHVWFYRQSDIAEIPQLTWLLTCVCGKGLLNRAHAYKAAVDKNTAAGEDEDNGINMGLFMYPVLMAADILMFQAHKVPVGRDQVQHLEMARDIASRFNHLYGEHFVLPQAEVDNSVATLPGLDGRKMSKSYDNTIPLFLPSSELKRLVFSLKTDSLPPGTPKQTENSALFEIYQAFATQQQTQAMKQAFADGIAWSDAKQMLFETIDQTLAPMREKYTALIHAPDAIEKLLHQGAEKARALAAPFMRQLRDAVGLHNLAAHPMRKNADDGKHRQGKKPLFKQYREQDGQFYFKLFDETGRLILRSAAFASAPDAGKTIGRLRTAQALNFNGSQVLIADNACGTLEEGIDHTDLLAVLQTLAEE